jgi:hypothetical protein
MKTITDHILDICQNSIRAKTKLIEIIIEEDNNFDLYKIKIRDNGEGMDEEITRKAVEPFFTSRNTRKVGLGLALLKQNTERTGGSLWLKSVPGKGTDVEALFKLNHIDRPPLGDLAETLVLLIIGNEKLTFKYYHTTPFGTFGISSSELTGIFGNIPLKNKEVREAIIEFIKNNQDNIKISK